MECGKRISANPALMVCANFLSISKRAAVSRPANQFIEAQAKWEIVHFVFIIFETVIYIFVDQGNESVVP
jgi:hypothetical protein